MQIRDYHEWLMIVHRLPQLDDDEMSYVRLRVLFHPFIRSQHFRLSVRIIKKKRSEMCVCRAHESTES
jgi:hypothetical protein